MAEQETDIDTAIRLRLPMINQRVDRISISSIIHRRVGYAGFTNLCPMVREIEWRIFSQPHNALPTEEIFRDRSAKAFGVSNGSIRDADLVPTVASVFSHNSHQRLLLEVAARLAHNRRLLESLRLCIFTALCVAHNDIYRFLPQPLRSEFGNATMPINPSLILQQTNDLAQKLMKRSGIYRQRLIVDPPDGVRDASLWDEREDVLEDIANRFNSAEGLNEKLRDMFEDRDAARQIWSQLLYLTQSENSERFYYYYAQSLHSFSPQGAYFNSWVPEFGVHSQLKEAVRQICLLPDLQFDWNRMLLNPRETHLMAQAFVSIMLNLPKDAVPRMQYVATRLGHSKWSEQLMLHGVILQNGRFSHSLNRQTGARAGPAPPVGAGQTLGRGTGPASGGAGRALEGETRRLLGQAAGRGRGGAAGPATQGKSGRGEGGGTASLAPRGKTGRDERGGDAGPVPQGKSGRGERGEDERRSKEGRSKEGRRREGRD